MPLAPVSFRLRPARGSSVYSPVPVPGPWAHRLGEELPDGRVELEVQGAVSDLRRFYVALKSQPHIRISHADIAEIPLRDGEHHFSILRREND